MKLRDSQRKALSDFLNTIAAAWFSAGIISPIFIRPDKWTYVLLLGGISVFLTTLFLFWSLELVKKVRL